MSSYSSLESLENNKKDITQEIYVKSLRLYGLLVFIILSLMFYLLAIYSMVLIPYYIKNVLEKYNITMIQNATLFWLSLILVWTVIIDDQL